MATAIWEGGPYQAVGAEDLTEPRRQSHRLTSLIADSDTTDDRAPADADHAVVVAGGRWLARTLNETDHARLARAEGRGKTTAIGVLTTLVRTDCGPGRRGDRPASAA